jgi:hypothetical protein
MRLLTWAGPVAGKFHGTIQCADGNLLLRDIEARDRQAIDDAVLAATNDFERLPPRIEEATEALEALGWRPYTNNGHPAIEPVLAADTKPAKAASKSPVELKKPAKPKAPKKPKKAAEPEQSRPSSRSR